MVDPCTRMNNMMSALDIRLQELDVRLQAVSLREQQVAIREQQAMTLGLGQQQQEATHGDPSLRDIMRILIRMDTRTEETHDMMRKLLLNPVVKEINRAMEMLAQRNDGAVIEIAALGTVIAGLAERAGSISMQEAREEARERMQDLDDDGSQVSTAAKYVRASASASESLIDGFEASRIASLAGGHTHSLEAASAIHLAASGGLGDTTSSPASMVTMMNNPGLGDSASPGFG